MRRAQDEARNDYENEKKLLEARVENLTHVSGDKDAQIAEIQKFSKSVLEQAEKAVSDAQLETASLKFSEHNLR